MCIYYNMECVGFKQRGVFKVVRLLAGIMILNTLTRLEYNAGSQQSQDESWLLKQG
jgi:hypothetical protein